MKATVYYIELTEAQQDELNAQGWDSKIGKAYLNARTDKIDATNFDLLVKAATLDVEGAEIVWRRLQNLDDAGWAKKAYVRCHTEFPRSMDIGDIIVWEDGSRERCAPIGFEPIEA